MTTSSFASEISEVETFFFNYLVDIRSKNEVEVKKAITPSYLKKLGNEKGLKELLLMQDGKKEKPIVHLQVSKGKKDIFFIDIKNSKEEHTDYLYVVKKVDGKFKIDGTILKEED